MTPAFGLVEDASGRLLATGRDGSPLAIARYKPSGDLDGAFGTGGLAANRPLYGTGAALAIQRDGRVVSAGVALIGEGPKGTCVVVIRRKIDGSSDPSFSNDRPGRVFTCHSVKAGLEGRSVVVGNDRKITVGGVARYGIRRATGIVLRYLPDGSLDKTFAGDARTDSWRRGAVEIGLPSGPVGSYSAISEIKLLSRGKILAGGTFGGKFMVARINRNGSLDRRFGKNGMTTVDVDGSKSCRCAVGWGLARDRKRRILLAGYTFDGPSGQGEKIVLIRLHPDGRIDRSFGRNGLAHARPRDSSADSHFAFARRVAVQRDGRIVVAGESDSRFTLLRFRADGRLDRSFFSDGVYATQFFGGQPSAAWDVLIDRKGRIVASGGGPGIGQFVLMRFLPK